MSEPLPIKRCAIYSLSSVEKDNRAATLESGRWQGTSCPLGYFVKNDRLVVDVVEPKIVQEIFTRYANEESVTKIIGDLTKRGVKTK